MASAPRKQKLALQKDIDWRLALKERPFLGFFVLLARGTMLVAIVATFFIATALLLYALYEVYDAVKLLLTTKTDGKKLTLAAGIGQLSLALREVASDKGEETDRITTADLVSAMRVEPVAAPAEPVDVVKVQEPPSRASVSVYRGIEVEVYEVPRTR